MDKNKLAVIVSYYLARFDREALRNLGYNTYNEAFQGIADKLGVKKNYIKLTRDEFDPVFPWREGWKRPMDRRIVKTIEAFQELSESDVREIVLNILSNPDYRESEEISNIASLLDENKSKTNRKGKFILRAPTGKKAEEYFIEYYQKNKQPVAGIIKDMRDQGCGYDFEIITERSTAYIEVKGLIGVSGGIVFTNKEWHTALASGNSYYLVIVKSVSVNPEIKIIQNPALRLKAKKSIYTSIQIQWSIPEIELIRSK